MSDRQSFTQAVYDYFKARPRVPIHSDVLARIGGKNGWRTRVSNARKRLQREAGNFDHDPIANNLARHPAGHVDSYYVYIPFPKSESVTVRVEDNGQAAFI